MATWTRVDQILTTRRHAYDLTLRAADYQELVRRDQLLMLDLHGLR